MSITDVEKFLINNGFTIGDDVNSYANEQCNVVISISNEQYEVANNLGDVMYSENLNIYWLIGVLTYYNLIDRNYETQYK